MPPSNKDINNSPSESNEWYKHPFTKIAGAITTLASCFVLGMQVGVFKQELDFRAEKLELKQEYSEKIQEEKNNCREAELQRYAKSVEDLQEVVKELSKK